MLLLSRGWSSENVGMEALTDIKCSLSYWLVMPAFGRRNTPHSACFFFNCENRFVVKIYTLQAYSPLSFVFLAVTEVEIAGGRI